MCSHVPNKGEQMVRYYGYYSNVSRGQRKKQNQDGLIPCILEPEEPSKEYRKNWARLIQKIYEVDPLTCPKCQGRMRIISFIEDDEIIQRILKHLGLWFVKRKVPPRAISPPSESYIDHSDSQMPPSGEYHHIDPDYPIDMYASYHEKASSYQSISFISGRGALPRFIRQRTELLIAKKLVPDH